ncbi:MAG: flagellar protein FlaG [Caldimicrobium sp.]|nr:flagellar protein FlaG [Caldimicrobium sp.]
MDIREILIPKEKSFESPNLKFNKTQNISKLTSKEGSTIPEEPKKEGLWERKPTSSKQNLALDIEKINRVLLSINKVLEIEVDKDLKIPIYKIIDLTTKEVLKQIPLQDIVEFKRALYEFMKEKIQSEELIKGIFIDWEV